MAGNLDMALESLDMPPALHDSMVEKMAQQNEPQQKVENTAPAASVATAEEKPAANTETPLEKTEESATNENKENEVSDDTIVIDPTKKIQIGDEVLTWEQLQLRSTKKAAMDKEQFQIRKERESLDLEKQDIDAARYWKAQMENDDFARNYMTLKASGMSREDAFAAALKVGGLNLPAQSAPTPEPVLGIDTKELADRLPKLPSSIEPNSDEHTKWYTEVYEPAKMAAVAEMTGKKIVAQIESSRIAEQKAAIDAEARKQQAESAQKAIIEANQKQMDSLPNMLWTMYGIEVSKLSQEQRDDITSRVSGVMSERGINPDDPKWMASHTLDPLHIEAIVRASIPEGKNPYTNSQKLPIPDRPKANLTAPLSAGRSQAPAAVSTNGAERYGSPMEAAVASLDM